MSLVEHIQLRVTLAVGHQHTPLLLDGKMVAIRSLTWLDSVP